MSFGRYPFSSFEPKSVCLGSAIATEDEEDIFEIDIGNKTYCTNDEKNGKIYNLINDEIGNEVGFFKNGKPVFIEQ